VARDEQAYPEVDQVAGAEEAQHGERGTGRDEHGRHSYYRRAHPDEVCGEHPGGHRERSLGAATHRVLHDEHDRRARDRDEHGDHGDERQVELHAGETIGARSFGSIVENLREVGRGARSFS
jgi:hypothetical protein